MRMPKEAIYKLDAMSWQTKHGVYRRKQPGVWNAAMSSNERSTDQGPCMKWTRLAPVADLGTLAENYLIFVTSAWTKATADESRAKKTDYFIVEIL